MGRLGGSLPRFATGDLVVGLSSPATGRPRAVRHAFVPKCVFMRVCVLECGSPQDIRSRRASQVDSNASE